MIEKSEESESQIEGLLWAKGVKHDRKIFKMSPKSRDCYGPRGPKMIEKVKITSPKSRDCYGPRGPQMIEKSENHESQIEGLLWATGSTNDRKK